MVRKKILKCCCTIGLIGTLISNISLATTGTVTGGEVNIRERADSKALEVSVAKKGEKVEVIGEEGNWYHIKFENVTGYISKDYVDTDYVGNTETTPAPETPVENPPVSETPVETPPDQNTQEPENNSDVTIPEEPESTDNQTPENDETRRKCSR